MIFDKVFELFRHFQTSPVLQPSLGRLINDRIKLFDGQHKAAALLWNGRAEIDCKVYIDSDMRVLNQTNIAAHDKFAQTRFYTSIMVGKLGKQFGTDFTDYKNLEDGKEKSEAGFVNYLKSRDRLTTGEVNKRFRAFLYDAIIDDEDNRLSRLVAIGNRATDERPIALNGLTNSIFASFLYREPTLDNLVTDAYKRDIEAKNVVRLLNLLDKLALSQWNKKATVSGDDLHRKLSRLIRTTFMKAWAEILKDAILAKLSLYDSDDRFRPFYREFTESQWEEIEFCVTRLTEWKIWSSPKNSDIDTVRLDSDHLVKTWLKENILTTGYLMGASE